MALETGAEPWHRCQPDLEDAARFIDLVVGDPAVVEGGVDETVVERAMRTSNFARILAEFGCDSVDFSAMVGGR